MKNKIECEKCLNIRACKRYCKTRGYDYFEFRDFCDKCRKLLAGQGWKLLKL